MAEQVYPEPTTGALVVNKDGKILLVKSFKWYDKWTIPGGHIELGETMEHAAKREMKEEVGLDVEIVDFLGVQEAIFTTEFTKRKHFVFLDFVAKCENDKVKADNDEIQNFIWVDPEEALKLDLESFTKKRLELYLKKFHKI